MSFYYIHFITFILLQFYYFTVIIGLHLLFRLGWLHIRKDSTSNELKTGSFSPVRSNLKLSAQNVCSPSQALARTQADQVFSSAIFSKCFVFTLQEGCCTSRHHVCIPRGENMEEEGKGWRGQRFLPWRHCHLF